MEAFAFNRKVFFSIINYQLLMLKYYRLFLYINLCSLLHNTDVWAWQSTPILNKSIGFKFENENLRSITLPIKVFHNLVLVGVRINGSFDMDFILDTGVQTTILTEPVLCSVLQIKTGRAVQLRGLGVGDTIAAQLASDVRISLGQAHGQNMNLLVLPSEALSFSDFLGMPVYGIIGYDLFQDFVVEINYTDKWLRLHRPDKYKAPKKFKSADIELNHTKPYLNTNIYTCDSLLFKQKLLLDTGSSQAVSLNRNEVDMPTKTIEAFLGKGLSGLVLGDIGYICALEMAGFSFKKIIAGFPTAESLGAGGQTNILWNGSIGGEIFKRFRIIFDYTHQKVYFKPNYYFKAAFEYNLSGIEMHALPPDFKTVKVSYVRPKSISEDADIQIGDEILSINGLSPQNTFIGDLYEELNKKSGYVVNLKILREGVVLKKKIILKETLSD